MAFMLASSFQAGEKIEIHHLFLFYLTYLITFHLQKPCDAVRWDADQFHSGSSDACRIAGMAADPQQYAY